MILWSKSKTSRSQHTLAVSSRLRGLREPAVRDDQSGQGSGYDEHRRGASLPKTVAVPDFVDPVQLTNKNGPTVDNRRAAVGVSYRLPQLPEATRGETFDPELIESPSAKSDTGVTRRLPCGVELS